MEIILTSFGLSHLRRREEDNPDIFYRMPPIAMSQVNSSFLPDYAVLLLCDRVIIDSTTYSRLVTQDESHRAFKEVGNVLKMLNDEGFLRIEDFDKVVDENKTMLQDMLTMDLKEIDIWAPVLKESASSWRIFVESINSSLRNELYNSRVGRENLTDKELAEYQAYSHHTASWLHTMKNYAHGSYHRIQRALDSSRDRRKKEFRDVLKNELSEYLSYVNANLVLCQNFETGFHDWSDYHPFYQAKFNRVGRKTALGKPEIDNIQRLFEISFPNLTFWDPKFLIKALKDKRINDLRQLVDRAVKGEVEFDIKFASTVLDEVFRIERRISKLRSVVSYTTAPLGFIPWAGTPIQKVAEDATVASMAKKRRKPFQWFYMISDLSEKYRRKQMQQE